MTMSTQHLLDKVRKPRVHITYDVQIGDAIEKKELPFVIGILANLSGMSEEKLPKLKDRNFVFVDSDNLEEVFASSNPRIKFDVKDVINAGSSGTLSIDLKMKTLDDFSPINLVKAVPELSAIYQEKVMMKDLLGKLEGNELLRDILKLIAEDDDTRNNLKQIIKTMKDQLAPKDQNSDANAKALDESIDTEIKKEIKTAEVKKKSAKQKSNDKTADADKMAEKPGDNVKPTVSPKVDSDKS